MLLNGGNIDMFIQCLDTNKFLALDTETYGLELEDKPFAIIISNGINTGYLELRNDYHLKTKLQKLLDNEKIIWFFFNAKFDLQKLRMIGLNVKGHIHDCGSIERIIDNNITSISMSTIGERYGYPKLDIVKHYMKENKIKCFADVPLSIMQPYAENDAKVTYDIGMRQVSYVNKNPSIKNTVFTEYSIVKTCFHMEQIGIKVDTKYVTECQDKMLSNMQLIKSEFKVQYNCEFVTRGNALKELLDTNNVQYATKKGTGRPILNKDALEKINHPICKMIVDYRKQEKFIETYYTNILNNHRGGVIYPNIRHDGTKTGRFSYWGTGLQTLPKRELGEFSVRRCFVPRKDFKFVMIDYDQQEFRVCADYAGEIGLIREINKGLDVHQVTADMIGISREQGKTLNFAVIYGLGIKALAEYLKTSESEARKLKSKYFLRLSKMEYFIRKVIDRGNVTKKITDCFGKIYRVDSRDDSYKLPNHLIQGTCGGIMKRAMNKCHKLLSNYNSNMIVTVHDEIVFEIHNNELFLIEKLKEIMENIYVPKNKVKLTVSIKWSDKSWQDKQPL
jgi:DNA polymerase I